MRGLLADANVEGHADRLYRVLEQMGLWHMLSPFKVQFAKLADVGLSPDIDDASLWSCCQKNGWVLFTDNRNEDEETSLQSTLLRLWQPGDLPLVTLADKKKFELIAEYRERVAADIADVLFGILDGEYCDRARIYVPR